MIFDIISTVTEASIAFRHISHKQMFHETLCIPKIKFKSALSIETVLEFRQKWREVEKVRNAHECNRRSVG